MHLTTSCSINQRWKGVGSTTCHQRAVHLLACLAVFLQASSLQAAERLVQVSTASELASAIGGAIEGDVIELADGTYVPVGGEPFLIPGSETANFTIRAANSGAAAIDGGSGSCAGRSRLLLHQGAGWVVFDGIVFRDGCTMATGQTGGVDLRNGARATFVDCDFIGNQAETFPAASGSSAGALLVTAASQAQFIDCTFTGNSSDSHGGAALIGQGSRVFIHDSTFTSNQNNVVDHRMNGLGGAIHLFNGSEGTTSELYVSNSRFESNEAAFVGGAIMAKGNFASVTQTVASPSHLVVANSTFVGNTTNPLPGIDPTTPTEGGAIMVENDVSLEVYHSRFEGNSSAFGGAISTYRGAVTIRDSVFRDNRAFGRASTNTDGLGGAIRAHSSEACASEDQRTASLDVADSVFENNEAQWGGAINVTGDVGHQFNPCSGNLADNRAPLSVVRSVFSGNSVDNVISNNALGGCVYGGLVDVTVGDALFLDSHAYAGGVTDTTIAGGAVAFRQQSRVSITDSTFAGNSSEKEGGALHVYGGELASMNNLRFFANVVAGDGGASASSSRGAALFLSPDTSAGADLTGSVNNSTFSDNVGLAIREHDVSGAGEEHNFVTYEDNVFHETTFGDDVFYNILAGPAVDVAGLNALMVNQGDGSTDKAPGNSNFENGSSVTTAALLGAPPDVLGTTASGDGGGPSDVYVAWAWNGGCAELDGTVLDEDTEVTGFRTEGAGTNLLEVWDGACGAGAADASEAVNPLTLALPNAALSADPVAITGGGSSELSWGLTQATFLAGIVSHGVDDLLTTAAGSGTVTPANTTRYRLIMVGWRGGDDDVQGVFVDQDPEDLIFADGFESGDTSSWGS